MEQNGEALVPVKCPDCNGSGKRGQYQCGRCGGEGQILVLRRKD